MKKLIIRDIALFGLATAVLAPALALAAGTLDSPASPTDPGSAMVTTDALYNRLQSGAAGAKRSGAFSEPAVGPANTGKTLNEIMAVAPKVDTVTGAAPSEVTLDKTYWSVRTDSTWGLQAGTRSPAKVPKSGKTATMGVPGEDGALQKGEAWPVPRFTDNNNGTITDNLTGLIWLQNADCFGGLAWSEALTAVGALNSGECGLSDGSQAGSWRLPQIAELSSLVDYGRANPALPVVNSTIPGSVHPFSGVHSEVADWYWSSTTMASNTGSAWCSILGPGNINAAAKTTSHFVWPVRGGR